MSNVVLPRSEKQEPPEFEEGRYTLTVKEVTADLEAQYQGKTRPQFVWEFEGADFEDPVKAWTSMSYFEGGNGYPASKLYQWCKKIGVTPSFVNDPEGDGVITTLNTDDFEGIEVEALVEKTKNGWPRVTKIYAAKVSEKTKDALASAEKAVKDAWDAEAER